MTLYQCNSCSEKVPAHKARIHCRECRDYDSCTNCYVLGLVTTGHLNTHPTVLLEKSGYVPPPPPPRPGAPMVAQDNNWTPPQPRAESVNTSMPAGQYMTNQQTQVPSPPAQMHGWQPLFNGSKATPAGVAFLNSVFNILDPNNTGSLSPEQYSAFCDVQGYGPDDDVWKKHNKPGLGYNALDVADYEYRTVLENWSIDFILHRRDPSTTIPTSHLPLNLSSVVGPSFAKLLSDSIPAKSFSNGLKPMLTRKGFIDLVTIESVADPSAGWAQLTRVVRHYGMWRAWGDLPRSMLPQYAPQDLVDRLAQITALSRRQAQGRIAANAQELMLKEQGRQTALSLLDPPGTRYYYS